MKHCHALNYTESCIPDLLRFADGCERNGWPLSAKSVRAIIPALRAAQHFVFPDGGRLLDDGLRGLRSRSPRLPFPSVTVEYYAEQDDGEGCACSKRIALAYEITYDQVNAILEREGLRYRMPETKNGTRQTAIAINAIDYADMHRMWCVQALTVIVPQTWDDVDGSLQIEPLYRQRPITGKDARIAFVPLVALPEMAAEIIKEYGEDEGRRQLAHDVSDEVTAILELCEALTCVNVQMEKIQSLAPRVNDRREAAGKMRLPDAWCLTLDVPLTIKASSVRGGTHSSPRTHLRRGHIRRLESGKNVWVNSTIVGSGPVRIDKHYHLHA